MKRTPVLIDVNGVPLRESLSYNGGGAGFGGQMAEWLPPAQSADAALLPALRLGNARADDLVRNNGIAANAVALHKDHIVGHMFLISYRPNWRWLGMRETATKSFVDEVEAAPVRIRRRGVWRDRRGRGNARLQNLFVKVWAFMRLIWRNLCAAGLGSGEHATVSYAFLKP